MLVGDLLPNRLVEMHLIDLVVVFCLLTKGPPPLCLQFLIAFLHYDVSHLPTEPLSLDLEDER